MKVLYPASHQIPRLSKAHLSLKIARYSTCSVCETCGGLHPPSGVDVFSDDEFGPESSNGDHGSDDDGGVYLEICACGHSVNEHNADPVDLGEDEFARRSRVAVRLDELLKVWFTSFIDLGQFTEISYFHRCEL